MQNSKSLHSIPLLIVCGYCTLGYVIFALGLLGICKPRWVFNATAIAISIFLPLIILQLRKEWRSISWKTNLIIVGFFSLLYAPILLIPPFMRDDMIYHLLIPKQMVMTGRFAFDPFNATSNFPMLFEMPLVIFELLKNYLSPFVVNIFFTLMFLVVFSSGLTRFTKISKTQNYALTLAIGTTPILFDLLHSSYVEIFFALLILLATYSYLELLEKNESANWIQTCIYLGLAAAVKYPGLIFLAFFFSWEFFRSQNRKIFYLGVAISLLLPAPWYLKNWIWAHNPFFPLANSFFNSPFLSATRAEGIHRMLADYNMGRTWMDLAKLPFRLAFGIDEARPGAGLGFDGKVSLLFGLAVFGLGWKGQGQKFISVLFLFYFSVWIFESQQARFLLAILPLPIIYSLRRLERFPKTGMMCFLLCPIILIQNSTNIYQKLRSEKLLDLYSGKLNNSEFLTAQMPISYGLAAEINSRLNPKTDKLMTVGCFGRNYYFDVPVLTNTFYDQEVFRNAFERGNLKPDSVTTYLHRNHVTHILFNWEFVRKMHERDVGFDLEALKVEIDSKWKVLKTGQVTLYSIF